MSCTRQVYGACIFTFKLNVQYVRCAHNYMYKLKFKQNVSVACAASSHDSVWVLSF